MSSPRLDLVVAAIVTALSAVHGSGDDALDLSASGRVLRGRYPVPPQVPFAAVSGVAVAGKRGAVLNRWQYTCSLKVVVWAAVPTLALSARVTRAELVLHYATLALTTAAATPGNALYGLPDLEFELATVDADLDAATEHAAQCGITVSWLLHRQTAGLSS